MLRYIRPVWYQTIIFGAIVLLAAVLRLWAIGWGLPYIDHPDEPAVAESALGMLRYHDWNPRFFDYPSFYLYALRIVFDAHWRYGLATGLYNSSAQIPHFTRPYEHPNANYLVAPGFFLWGRALTAIFGTITVALVYVVGRRWWSPSVGLVAALVLATLPFHIRHSQYITVDAATAMTTLIAVAMALRPRARRPAQLCARRCGSWAGHHNEVQRWGGYPGSADRAYAALWPRHAAPELADAMVRSVDAGDLRRYQPLFRADLQPFYARNHASVQ